MKKALWTTVILVLAAAMAGCAAAPVLIGASAAGVGVYSYFEGELQRSYQVPYSEAIQASLEVAEELRITVSEKIDEGITYIIKGKQPDNTAVSITIRTLSPETTQVGVRVGVTGLWDRQSAQTIQNYIAKAL